MSPSDSDCGSRLFAEQQFAPTDYATSPYSEPPSKFSVDDPNNNNNLYEDDFYGDSLSSDLSSLSICPEESELSTPETTAPSTPKRRSKKRSRSKCKTSTSSESSDERQRKDSFVYDVRLPDEQFLFFVPDLVSAFRS